MAIVAGRDAQEVFSIVRNTLVNTGRKGINSWSINCYCYEHSRKLTPYLIRNYVALNFHLY